ncbi:hypothetical protein Hanom_Chr16g01458621 [Helianthus anomalus]
MEAIIKLVRARSRKIKFVKTQIFKRVINFFTKSSRRNVETPNVLTELTGLTALTG